MFSEVAEIALVAPLLGQFQQLLKARVISLILLAYLQSLSHYRHLTSLFNLR